MDWDISYPTVDVLFPCREFASYQLYINSKTEQVVKAQIAYFSKKKKGVPYDADIIVKKMGEDMFDQLVRRVFKATQRYNWVAVCDIKENFPNLYMRLLNS